MISLDGDKLLKPQFADWAEEGSRFKLSLQEFEQICNSRTTNIVVNSADCENVNYHEFMFYSCRFYNMLFDERKFPFSLYKKLIAD